MTEILIIAPQPFFSNRGTPLNVKAMSVALSEGGYRPHLLVYPIGSDIEIPGVVIHRSPRVPFIRDVPIGPSYRKVLLDCFMSIYAVVLQIRFRFRVVHGIEEGAFIAGVIGLLFRRPYVVDVDSWMCDQIHASGLPGARWLMHVFSLIENFFLRRSAAVITVCGALTERVLNVSKRARVFQIEDFPIDAPSENLDQTVNELRARYSPHGEKLVVYTGNLEVYQGIDLLLEGFSCFMKSRLSGDLVDVRLVVVGGEQKDIARSIELAGSLGIDKSVSFAGRCSLEDAQAYLKIADVLASPRIEGVNTPLKVYSYMQSGVPIVATDILSHTQVLASDSAFLSNTTAQGFGHVLAQALDFSIAGKAERDKRAMRAKSIVESCYSYAAFKRRVVDVYDSILDRRKVVEQDFAQIANG